MSDAPVDELVSPYAGDDEQVVEAALRPKGLDEFVGQERVREQLSLVLDAARLRGRPRGHHPRRAATRTVARPLRIRRSSGLLLARGARARSGAQRQVAER